MHKPIHEIIAAIGGILFIVLGIARQRERIRLARSGKTTESAFIWNILIIAGLCLLIFAFGLIIYQSNNNT